MPRPTFIVAEPEPEQALSSRKILLETFKYNVITAHSVAETLDLVDRFPKVDAVILHCSIPGFDVEGMIDKVRSNLAGVPIIALTPSEHGKPSGADHVVHSHDPQALLDLVQNRFGDPRKLPTARNRPSNPIDPQEQ